MALSNSDLDAVLTQPLSAARASGRPIVAFVSNNVPIELIDAAGCFPLQLPTAPRAATPLADRYLESRFDPEVRVALEQRLGGELAGVKLLVLPRTIDAWQRLYYYLCELPRSFGEEVPEAFLYDLLQLPFDTSAEYNLESTRALARKLEAIGGRAITDRALADSIARYDRIRGQLARVAARRHADPCELTGADALALYSASQRLPPERLEIELERVLERDADAACGVRTLLVGSAHDSPALHEQIARAGGQVVADYHWRGDLLFGPVIGAHDEPLRAISEHYHRRTFSARIYPSPLEPLLDLAARSGARAAVFFYYDEEEALTWEQPAQEAALRAKGLATLTLARQPYPASAALESELRRFFAAEP